ncbi:glycosyltransferase 87 family protein [Tomitella biformata]|uniref:glycosyltransferase 87 family protein n=1 Tax=Tomitella biformata TaxID=630403 RepID=UPI000465E69E|nr:glycosyltransferase 87 family protein [Tomitella biformata]
MSDVDAEHEVVAVRSLSWRPAVFVGLGAWAVAALVLLVTQVSPRAPGIGILAGGVDLNVYRDGAGRILEGLPLYTEPVIYGLMYTYTPFSTIVFIPLHAFPTAHVVSAWMLANLCALLACVLMSWRMLRYRLTPPVVLASVLITGIMVFLEPVRTTLFYGQINLWLMLLVLWDFSRHEKGLLRGIGIGVAAGIKLTPGYFIVMLLALRQWRTAAVATGTVALSVLVTWAILPRKSREYWTHTFFQADRIGEDRHPANQSIRGLLGHLVQGAAPTWLWLLLVVLITAVSLTVTVRLYQRDEQLLAVILSGLTSAAVSPFSWGHHWVWFVPLFVYLVHRALGCAWWWIAAVALFAATAAWTYVYDGTDIIAVGLFLFPPWWTGIQFLLNIYITVFAAVLIGAIVRVWKPVPPNAPACGVGPSSESVAS